MFDNMSIYVCTDAIPYFVSNILPRIKNTFYLVSGDSDVIIPSKTENILNSTFSKIEENVYVRLLCHPKLIKWFAQNCILENDKVVQLPIGLDYHTISNDPNRNWRDEYEGSSAEDQEQILKNIKETMVPFYERTNDTIFANFTMIHSREVALNNIPQELLSVHLDFYKRTNLWKTMLEYKFILSPYGAGPDCHRTWEALCLGCIPIINNIGSNSMFHDLPVLIVEQWSDINEELLRNTVENYKQKYADFNFNKLLLSYWTDQFCFTKNPFLIDIEDKIEYTNEELYAIQQKLDKKQNNIRQYVKNLYPYNDSNFNKSLEDITKRSCKGVDQKIIDIENNIYPRKTLYKIGDGGDHKNCIVCCTNLSSDREKYSNDICDSLKNTGFNGHFYLFNGTFPNPTGTEMKYVGVPYCFKIFMMLEAKKLGFEKIVWIDAACYAVNNPQKIFDLLNEEDAVFRHFSITPPDFSPREMMTLKHSVDTINIITGTHNFNAVMTSIVFGLNFNSKKINKFVEEYYEMVKVGTPFFSWYPEEVVMGSIFNKDEYKYLLNFRDNSYWYLYIHEFYADLQRAKESGFIFVQRIY
jgi:hypothetical protein